MKKVWIYFCSWFEIISKNSDKLNTFKYLIGLNDMIEDINMNGNKKRIMDEDTSEIRNKRMKVSRLLCNEEMMNGGSPNSMVSDGQLNSSHNGIVKQSDEENSDEMFQEEDETSYPDSFESNDGNSPNNNNGNKGANDDYSDNEGNNGLQIDEVDSLQKLHQLQRRHLQSTIDLTNINVKSSMPMVPQQPMLSQQQQQQQQMNGVKSTFGQTGYVTINSQNANNAAMAPSPKQLMTIREKMLEYIQQNPQPSTKPNCITVCQQPSSKVVWKNRRLDTPFKLRLDTKVASQIANQQLTNNSVISIGIVTDHKGKLQIDSVENFTEPFNASGISVFQGLKMTKGTWGKEWNLTFIAIVRPSSGSYNNPVILSVSQPFSIVVKTRKNPQIRHSSSSQHNLQNSMNGGYPHMMNSASENSSSSPDTSPTMAPRRGRIPSNQIPSMSLQNGSIQSPPTQQQSQQQQHPLLSHSHHHISSSSSSSSSPITQSSNPITNPSGQKPYLDDMASLLWAAEIKQQDQPSPPTNGKQKDHHQSEQQDTEIITSPSSSSSSSNQKNFSLINLSTPKPVTTR
ncbi:hypothetical protein DLAC_04855 [Tieghemostelium lacteum]|uniref:Uncharacterized protein n=1 Tax=Tieghemostelium lacteum TaxID=361077 RepID=A0A151ZJH9_TIELA|nr:hypothetical protein DLAC_04855 [Tieghemostelium lacteum]|eukprot:KYQ93964.1 hypothetical protein DLAC_04855 [Tieghemostelium lacteum]